MRIKREDRRLLLSICLLGMLLPFFWLSFQRWYGQNLVVPEEIECAVELPAPSRPVAIAKNPFFPDEVKEASSSQLVLRGVISGHSALAILEKATDPTCSWLVKEGDTVLGEKVLQIRSGHVELLVDNGEITVLELIKEDQANPSAAF